MSAREPRASGASLVVGATGVVFGDIGTSPLYAFRESFTGAHALPLDAFHVLGVLSMLVWALVIVVTVKYVLVTMRADNRGEGGSLALLALIRRKAPDSRALPALAMAALLATALFYGDAIITPAISVLSAVEGLTLVSPRFGAFVVPLTIAVVLALFAVQHRGTAVVGRVFGPVMLVWFLVIGAMGVVQVAAEPSVLAALNPLLAGRFLVADPLRAFLTLGTVVLAVTGAEALYADMGHFGHRPIARAWAFIALPALLACYAGQAALVLRDPSAVENPFFRMAPEGLVLPLVALATVATIVASQSIITGAFSVTQQAVQLGYLPRVRVLHTSASARGQVYAPGVNALLAVAVVALVLAFRSSSALAAAFGLAVTATMVLTTLMIGFVVFRVWRWNQLWAVPLFALLLALDLGLFAASTTKLLDGGWLPLVVAGALTLVFTTWRRGRELLAERLRAEALPVAAFLRVAGSAHRPPATAVYLTSSRDGVPPALLHNLKFNGVLHARVLLVTVRTRLTPRVAEADRRAVEELGGGLARVVLDYGFVERPDVPRDLAPLLEGAPPGGPGARPNALTTGYVLSRQTLVPSRRPGMAPWRDHLFAAMLRNAETPMTFFRLPPEQVVEIGSQVEI